MHDHAYGAERSIERGYIWLIEQAQDAPLSTAARRALAGAEVVIYHSSLAPMVADTLPLACYAEPWAGATDAPETSLAPRALTLAADGWSVALLVTACSSRGASLRKFVAADGNDLPANVIGDRGVLGPPTIVIGPLGVAYPRDERVFTANGLAG